MSDSNQRADEIDNIKKHADAQEKHSLPAKKDRDAIVFPEITYDVSLLDRFLDTVFGAGLDDDENILLWRVKPKKSPRFPESDAALAGRLAKTTTPYALYYATSTASKTIIEDALGEESEALRNRKAAFERFHVLVLDDIGTKVPLEKIPENMKPSYIIESSEGNFQYGYVLAEPLTDLHEAEALVNIAYTSGFSDEGGKMANKLVRLPEGVNGKDKKGGEWHVQLTELNDTVWTPEELLSAMAVPISWDELKKDSTILTKRNTYRKTNAAVWAASNAQFNTLGGIVDPVLEYLAAEKLVVNETEEWFTIQCPWGKDHTTGDTTAGYVPVGYGASPDTRQFNCFHESCAAHKTQDFLAWVYGVSGIEAEMRDFAAPLLARYVLNVEDGRPYELLNKGNLVSLSMDSFRLINGANIMNVASADGKLRKVNAVSLWGSSPRLVKFNGNTFDASDTSRFCEVEGVLKRNTFTPPPHDPAPIDMTHVNRFLEYIDYLVPEEEEREYLKQWIFAKIKNLSFRGAAIIMYTQGAQGIGRSTLMRMMEQILGSSNVSNVPFSDIVAHGNFNGWQAKPFVMVEEARSGGDFYTNYERLKEVIDPADSLVTINVKYERAYEARSCSSIIFLSNHIDGIRLPTEDRRFYPIANPLTPETPEFFASLNAWMKEGEWAKHVYNWIQTQEPDVTMLNAPPPKTEAKREVIEASRTLGDKVLRLLTDNITGFFTLGQVKQIIEGVAARTTLGDKLDHVVDRDIRPKCIGGSQRVKVKGVATRPKIFAENLALGIAPDPRSKRINKGDIAFMRKGVEDLSVASLVGIIVESLEADGL